MARMVLAVALALAAALPARAQGPGDPFQAETVAAMQALCTADQGTADGKYAVGFCYGWIEGLGQFYQELLTDKRFDFPRVICAGRELSREEVRSQFVDWARRHPADAGRPALAGIVDAMKEEYPCR